MQQVRGERVELEVPNRISGLIVGVEKRKEKVGDRDTIDIDVLDLLTEAGLRAIKLETVTSIKLANEKLDSELRKALALLASSHDTDKKTVTLNFLGHGKRQVRVGYIQETPVWKTSYRLLVDDENPPLLQGWAIVENTTENDWSGVNLALVSGRPISFVMDLYQPLYVARPRWRWSSTPRCVRRATSKTWPSSEAEFRQRGPMAGAATGDADGGDGWPTADDGASACARRPRGRARARTGTEAARRPPGTSSRACSRRPRPATWAASSSTPSARPWTWPGSSRPCCPSSTKRSRARRSRSTTSRSRPSTRCPA